METRANPGDRPATRRTALKWLLGFSVVSTVTGIVGPIIAYLLPAEQIATSGEPVEVGKLDDFPVGAGSIVTVQNKPVMIVNTKQGGLKAFSAICTHLGCIVYWDRPKGVMHSPCHDGLFNAVTGAVVAGPPPRPLPAYELAVKDGKVYVGKPLGQIYGA
ncbi:MAG: ubiquinol-cytochrome c reductase iron-sulfur subunit [Rudaea sp.]